jgi:hypothetical protein
MAIAVNTNELPENGKSDRKPETKFIHAGNQVARFVSYVELGKHFQMFKGARATYESGKNAGRLKPACLHVALTFEFPACEYTGDYPLTISTTRRMENGEFFNAVTVPDSLADGTISRGMALKTKFVKYLSALQTATGLAYNNFAEFARAQVPLMISVTNKLGAKNDDGTQPTYANMTPTGITAPKFQHPISKKVEIIEVPEVIETYCPAFEWDAPTPEAWKLLPPWHRKTIKKALDFAGSPADMMLQADPTLDAVTAPDADQDQTPNTPPEPPANPRKQSDIPV